MNLITIKNGNNTWNFEIENNKYIICDTNNYHQILQSIRLFNSKEKSEYRSENNFNIVIMKNEKELSLRNNLFIEISDSYSLIEDKKLTTKSLILKYLEVKLQNRIYFDTIGTIDILLESLAEEMNEDDSLNVQLNSVGYKQLIKMLTPFYIDEFQKDEFDLDYEQIILFQLQLVDYIAKNNFKYDNTIVYGHINNIGSKIVRKLKNLNNSIQLIFTNNYKESMHISEVALYEKSLMDFSSIEQFYIDYSQQSFQQYSLQEVECMIIEYLKQNYTHKKKDIYQELVQFSK